MQLKSINPAGKILKKLIIRIILFMFGKAIEAVQKIDKNAAGELSTFPEGAVIAIKPYAKGNGMVIIRYNGVFRYAGSKIPAETDLLISFKNINSAFKVLSGMNGIGDAYAQHRFTLEGDIFTTLPLVRAMLITETYLFPRFMVRKIAKEIPELCSNKFKAYLFTIAALFRRKYTPENN